MRIAEREIRLKKGLACCLSAEECDKCPYVKSVNCTQIMALDMHDVLEEKNRQLEELSQELKNVSGKVEVFWHD